MRMTMMMRLIRRRVIVIRASRSQDRAADAKNRKKDIDKPEPEHMATFEFFERARQLCRRCRRRGGEPLKAPAVKDRLFLNPFPSVVHRRKVLPFSK